MNRIVRFRAWDTEHKRFLTPALDEPYTGHVIDSKTGKTAYYHVVLTTEASTIQLTLAGEVFEACRYEPASRTDYPLQQWTGFVDKNGKEIYEGDLVNFRAKGFPHERYPEAITNAEVWFDPKYACFCFGRGGDEWTLLDGLEDFEVVGNVFETPNLLKNE